MSAKQYLDLNGLQTYTDLMKNYSDRRTGVFPVIGTQVEDTDSWTGTLSTVDELFAGLTIAYYLPYDTVGNNVTLNLTLSDDTQSGAVKCYFGTNRLTNEVLAGSVVNMTYYPANTISVYGMPITEDRWIITNFNYDKNDYLGLESGDGSIMTEEGYKVLTEKQYVPTVTYQSLLEEINELKAQVNAIVNSNS